MDKKRKVEGPGRRVLGNERFPLRGLLTCPKCGENLIASGTKGKSKTYVYFGCLFPSHEDFTKNRIKCLELLI